MPVIRLEKTILAQGSKVFDALTKQQQLQKWFAPEVIAFPKQGTYAAFAFGFDMHFKVYLLEMVHNQRITWEFIEGNVEWKGSFISFSLLEKNGKTKLAFVHKGLKNLEKQDKWKKSWREALSKLKKLTEEK